MLSSSHSKIHEPPVTGVSRRPARPATRSSETAKHETPCEVPKLEHGA